MILLFLVLLSTKVFADVSSDSDSQSQYVDLLPDDEKKDFLERVARRIIKDVESKEAGSVRSGEIPESMLKEQDEYVKTILKEESKTIRAQESEEHLKVIPLKFDQAVNYGGVSDSTVKPDKAQENITHKKPENVQVEIVKDDDISTHKKLKDNVNTESTTLKEFSTSKYVEEFNPEQEKLKNDYINKPENIDIESFYASNETENSVKISSNIYVSTNTNAPEQTFPTEININSQATEGDGTTATFEKDTSEPSLNQLTEKWDLEEAPISSTLNDSDKNSTYYNTLNDTHNSELTNIEFVQEIETKLRTLKPSIDESLQVIAGNQRNNNTSTTITKNKHLNKDLTENNDSTETKVERKTILLISGEEAPEVKSIKEKKPASSEYNKHSKKNILETNAHNARNDKIKPVNMIKIYKTKKTDKKLIKLNENKSGVIRANITNPVSIMNKDKTYKVYEISPNEPPFIMKSNITSQVNKSQPKNKRNKNVKKSESFFKKATDYSLSLSPTSPVADQPYLIPTYNYSPNKAYFNPVNRLGLNNAPFSSEENIRAHSNNEIIKVDINEHFDNPYIKVVKDNDDSDLDIDNNDSETNSNINTFNIKFPSNGIVRTKHDQKIVDVFPFADLKEFVKFNIYHGRKNNELSDSKEDIHPVNTIKQVKLKDHVRAVRNLYYNKDNYSNVPRKGKNKESLGKHKHFYSGIALDYFFGKNDVVSSENVFNKFFTLRTKNNNLDTATPHPYAHRFALENFKPNKRNTIQLRAVNKKKARTNKENDNNVNGHEDAKLNTLTKILSLTNERDVFPVLETLQSMKLKLRRRNGDVEMEAYLDVLKDMVDRNSKALTNYDFLETTVDIQAGLEKLFFLVKRVETALKIHPADAEILKYLVFLHDLAIKTLNANLYKDIEPSDKIPRYERKKVKPNFWKLDVDGTTHKTPRVLPFWYKPPIEPLIKFQTPIKEDIPKNYEVPLNYKVPKLNKEPIDLRRKYKIPIKENPVLQNFTTFLYDIDNELFDLHDTIKDIALVTTYINQNWFKNIREKYLNNGKGPLLKLLLHLSISRVFELVEDSCRNGLEDDFLSYTKKNKGVAIKTLEEIVFAKKVLRELNKLKE